MNSRIIFYCGLLLFSSTFYAVEQKEKTGNDTSQIKAALLQKLIEQARQELELYVYTKDSSNLQKLRRYFDNMSVESNRKDKRIKELERKCVKALNQWTFGMWHEPTKEEIYEYNNI